MSLLRPELSYSSHPAQSQSQTLSTADRPCVTPHAAVPCLPQALLSCSSFPLFSSQLMLPAAPHECRACSYPRALALAEPSSH